MAFEVTMPKLTDSMEEGRIVEWRVAPGDAVGEGDVLAEIETDKAVMELESFWSGTVGELLREAGEVVPVGEVIARIQGDGEGAVARAGEEPRAKDAPPAGETGPGDRRGGDEPARAVEPDGRAATRPEGKAAKEEEGDRAAEVPLPGAHPLSERGGVESPRPSPPTKEPPASRPESLRPSRGGAGEEVRASPRARRLARERGVDLQGVAGTGPDGRITTADVEAAARGSSQPGASSSGAGRADEELPPVRFAEGEAEVEEVSFFQKAAIRRVVASKHVIPHFYVHATVRADALLARKAAEKGRSGATLTHLLLRASAQALERFPDANRSYDRGRWIRWNVANLGLAIQTDAGLVVGVLRNAGSKDLAWIAERTRELVARAREGRLKPGERENATFTLSNLGAYDVESFSAIINPPSAMTLAAGSTVTAPVVEEGRLAVGTILRLSLSCDHRVVDGVLGAQFLGEVRRLLEEPGSL